MAVAGGLSATPAGGTEPDVDGAGTCAVDTDAGIVGGCACDGSGIGGEANAATGGGTGADIRALVEFVNAGKRTSSVSPANSSDTI